MRRFSRSVVLERKARCALGLALALLVRGAPDARAAESSPPLEAIGSIVCATTDEALRPPVKPKLTLVLSGGGARGAAHIGVLKVLDQLQIAPDFVVGTSMGAVVGGLYAAGWEPSEIEKLVTEVNLAGVFSDRIARGDKTYRRKRDDDLLLIPVRIRFRGWKPWLPPGVFGSNRLDLLLEAIEFASFPAPDFDAFPIPFRAVATDLKSGEAVVIGEGSLATAMRASMAVPAVFSPVSLGGRTLVDGGGVANLPIGVAQALGAERIIAVDITSPLVGDVEDGSFLTVMDQQSSFLAVANRLADGARLKEGDVRIVPDLGDITFSSFDRIPLAITQGENMARAMEPQLRPFAATSAQWERLQARRRERPLTGPVVDEIQVTNSAPIDDRIVRDSVAVPLGQAIDPRTFPARLMRLSGLGFFGKVETEFERSGGRGVLNVITRPRPFGRNTLQVGLGIENDFEGSSAFAFTLRHQTLPLNHRGGEWQNLALVGSTIGLASEWYQPLDTKMHWFVAPRLEYRAYRTDLYAGAEAVANFRVRSYSAELATGRVFGNWGELRAGLSRTYGEGTRLVGSALFPDTKDNLGGWFAELAIDTTDVLSFPRRGTRLRVRFDHDLDAFGGASDRARLGASAAQAFTFGKHTLTPSAEVYTTFASEGVSLLTAYRLGGFGRLSGLAEGQLFGSRGGLARLGYYYQWANLDLGVLSARAYAGFTLEAGNTFFDGDPISIDQLRYAGSIYVGADSVVGPAYLAWGRSEGGENRFYITIGRRL